MNSEGELGIGTTECAWTPALVGTGFVSVAAGDVHTVAMKADGTLWAWGSDFYGQLGDGGGFSTVAVVLAP